MAPPLSAWGWDRRWMTMRLHILKRGSNLTGSAGGGGGGSSECPAMDAAVWSNMPDDILWQVLVRLPVAKHFQLQVLSRKWRQVLTSADFRRAARSGRGQGDDQPVLACVTPGGDGSSSCGKLKVVDIDLSFLPMEWFGESVVDKLKYLFHAVKAGGRGVAPPYAVLAAADGLVCIGNKQMQVCVLNPLTRAYWMLPKIPWWDRTVFTFTSTGTTVSLSALMPHPILDGQLMMAWAVFAWELASGGTVKTLPVKYGAEPPCAGASVAALEPLVTLCCGQVFWFNDGIRGRRMLVLRDPRESTMVKDMRFPTSELLLAGLGFPASRAGVRAGAWDSSSSVIMGTHRDAVFVVVVKGHQYYDATRYRPGHLVCGVWRMDPPYVDDVDQSPERWGWVGSVLLTETVERLTGLSFADADNKYATICVCFAYGMRELLCCGVEVYQPRRGSQRFMLGLNLETDDWELVHDEQGLMHMEDDGSGMALKVAKMLELRPH